MQIVQINEYKEILKELTELNNLIDNKSIQIQESNTKYDQQIEKYKIMMENIILEYHNYCKKIFVK